MPRPRRADEAGGLYHALNRGNGRLQIFWKDDDYSAFERILAEGLKEYDVSVFSFQLMPNHWHLVLRPNVDGEMGRFLRWVTATHTMRYHAHYHTSGEGHVYQGRFKSFPIQDDEHFLTVCRYVERNALRAEFVSRAEEWRWGSLWR
jgi:putative transposase